MPDIYAFSSDPGKEVRTSRGSVINLVNQTQRTPEARAGVAIVGVIGTPANDRGAPNVPVRLSSVQDIFSRWGGFKACVGDGYAAGYNGNVAALLWGLLVRDIVFQPVDMALKDDTYADGTDLEVSLDRKFAITGAESTDVITTDRAHGLSVGDVVTFASITGGASVTWTGNKTVATVPSATTLTLTATDFSTDITAGTMTASARDPFTLPAGSQIQSSGAGFVVRTLEDVEWAEDDSSEQSVRVAKVSGTEAALNTIDELVDDTITAVRVTTTDTTVPDAVDAAEILLRYQAALDALNVNDAGQSVTVLFADRTEAGVGDALATHCSDAYSEGIFRIAVVAPPVGTTVANAEASSGNGAGRSTLNGEFAAYAHPGVKRRFPLDADNLSAADDYKAVFPAHALLAAKMVTVRPEENPTAAEVEPGTTYGVAELELVLSRTEKVTHFQAGICTTVFERVGGRKVASWRDGIMADGTKIARKRLTDFLAQGLIERLTPWHKRLASNANKQGALDACDTWLLSLEDSRDQRIAGHELTPAWDGDTSEFTVQADVVELGNLDIITIMLGVSASSFKLITSEAA